MIKIGVDLISGETDVRTLMKGVFDAVEKWDDIEVVVIGKPEIFEPMIAKRKKAFWKKEKEAANRISVLEATEIITMEDNPLKIIKQKKDSSIVKGLKAHKDRKIDAFFSPGNTGAIVVASALIMGRVKGIRKPALCTFVPNIKNETTLLLDVGASADADPTDLVKFAAMGRIFYREMMGVENPSVALLNIGEEAHKGSASVQEAYKMLSDLDLGFAGNVEGGDIFTGKVNVVVCAGSLGNTSLKVMEASAKTVTFFLKQAIKHSILARTGYLFFMIALGELKNRLDPEAHGGVPLLGVRGNVFIGHGNSGRRAITAGIKAAADAVRHNVLGKLHDKLDELGLE